jgi:myo-inositol-1-phosphate synthase|tara:strand:- start:7261 stop:8451 length:1191 start_codon:yes stop_codon:yes gene_type:complete
MSKKQNIRVAIVGVGNCANSLYQGLTYYAGYTAGQERDGVMKSRIGGYSVANIEVVAAFDVDRRKVGKCFREAMNAEPNCTPTYEKNVPDGPIVQMSPIMDGVPELMSDYPEAEAFRVADLEPVDVVQVLTDRKVDILINYLPVGSQKATEWYAEKCLEAGVSLLNCIPVFIASNPVWEQKFIDAGIPLIGDDMKSQFGASILSQMLQELAFARGLNVKAHIQRNVGGNTDFLNMVDQSRLKYKKVSKENVIRSQHTIRGVDPDESFLHAGPSEYIRYYKDNKVANFRVEMEGFLGAPVILDAQLSVIDSPNSGGVVIDAVRYLKVAREMGIVGALRGPSASTQKTPPQQLMFSETLYECDALSGRQLTRFTKRQTEEYSAEELYKLCPSHNKKVD